MLHTRKLWALMSLLVVVAMVFAACQPPQAPATPQPTAVPPAPAQPTQPPPPPAQPTQPPPPPPTEAPKVELMSKAEPDCKYADGAQVKSIEAVDELTVKFTLCAPDPAFLEKVAFGSLGIQSAKHLQDTGGKPVDQPVGTGPYVLKEWVKGDHVTLEANPNYWGEAPKTKTVIIKWNAEAAARLTGLQAGEVDGIDNVGKDDLAAVKADSTFALYPRAPFNVMYFSFNNTMPPFDNDKVRQALAIGIDRQAFIDKFYPPGTLLADYFTPCEILGGCEGDPWPKYDFNAAKAMLTAAGIKPGTKLVLSYRNNDRPYAPAQAKIAEELQSQLKKLGFDVTLDQQESGPFLSASAEGKLQFSELGWIGDFPDQVDWVGYHFNNPNEKQFGNMPSDLKDAITKADTTMDPAQRKQLFATVNNLIRQYVPMVPIAHSTSAVAFKASVQGAHSSPLSNEIFAVMQIPGQDQLVFSQNGEPPGLYCGDETDGEAFRICTQIFDSLYNFKIGGFDVQPALAESCTPNAEGNEWTCKLRSGVKFSNGTPLTANDVVATYAVQWDTNDPLHTGNTGDFAYWGALFGANIPKK